MTGRPRLLDLFCGAGGAARGYQLAGFHVTGVDIKPQPNYCGDEFVQADVLEFLHPGQRRLDFQAAHASPPCQAFTAYRRTGRVGTYPDLIAQTRELLSGTGLPWVIENVAGAPLHYPETLCGSMFDLDVQRHRLFEANWPLMAPVWPCRHKIWDENRYPGGRSKERHGDNKALVRRTVEIGSWDIPLDVQKAAMGVDWDVTLEELSEAIPPAFTEAIGTQLLAHLQAKTAA